MKTLHLDDQHHLSTLNDLKPFAFYMFRFKENRHKNMGDNWISDDERITVSF